MSLFSIKKLKNLFNRYYWIDRNYNYLRYCFLRPKVKTPLVIYQMGKVGSTTVAEALKKINIDYDIFHVHVLSKEKIKETERRYSRASKIHGRAVLDSHIIEGNYLCKRLEKSEENTKWKIVALVRDPIARNISAFFQTFHLYFPEKVYYPKDTAEWTTDLNVDDFISIFINQYDKHDLPLNWFDENILSNFGIDVFSTEFDVSKGYHIYQAEKIDLLILRTEDINLRAEKAFKEFLNLDQFSLSSENESREKHYARTYYSFIENISLPETYIDRMYNSKFMRKFYSRNEIIQLRQKWEKR